MVQKLPFLAKRLAQDGVLGLIKLIIAAYDLVSQPIFYLSHQISAKHTKLDVEPLAEQRDPADALSAWRQTKFDDAQIELERTIDSYDSYSQMMADRFRLLGRSPCYAHRKVLAEHWQKRPDSDKLIRQVELSEMKWVTFEQFDRQIEAAHRAFLLEGIRPGDKVMIYADTRAEWQIASQALMRLGAIVATMYATLGIEGIVHSVNETEVKLVVTQEDKVSRLLALAPRLPTLRKVLFFELTFELPVELGGDLALDAEGCVKLAADCNERARQKFAPSKAPNVEVKSFTSALVEASRLEGDQLRKLQAVDVECQRAKESSQHKDTPAVIMYTSGSTGIPKGVLISQRNLMATIKCFSHVTRDFLCEPEKNLSTAYLPLAHIFEFSIESMLLYHGVRFGFATPHTLTDKSPGLAPGYKGDLTLLRPTVMIIVPLILDRIVEGIKQALANESYIKKELVTYLIAYKSRWQRRHYPTPLVDRFICKKIASALGGNAKYVICGSAPLAPETQRFVRAALNLQLPQGFGTTETCAATACQLFEDQTTGNVGVPVAGCQVKLESWLEGNYRPTDKPNPRGEIVVGGDVIALGYYKLDEQTREAFYTDSEGIRWYRTGDIGEFLPNGNLKIIDRKKDLVKLQNGEYVSLGKIESTLKSNRYLENFCVYVNSSQNYVVALGPVNEAAIRELGERLVKEANEAPEDSSGSGGDQKRSLLGQGSRHADHAKLIEHIRQALAMREQDHTGDEQADQQQVRQRKGSQSNQVQNHSQISNQNSLDRNNNADQTDCATDASQQSVSFKRLQMLCQNELVIDSVLREITALARERNLMSLEIPKRLYLCPEEWTSETNLVTAALKIRRNYIYKRYERQLERLYESTNK